jgi:acetyl-CoA carboxylase biotin carboxyl carrier protein
MNRKRIEEIIDLMEKYGLTEVDVEEEGVRIHLKKGGVGSPVIIQQPSVQHVPTAVPAAGEPAVKAETKAEAKSFLEIKAPMVGTFYKAPAPDAEPYVDVGDTIKEGDILCIIEAMKLMNEIKSEVKGKIVEIVVDNGQPVEFGQVIFRVEPS